MKSPDTLGLFWDMAQLDRPVLAYDDLMRLPRPSREAWLATGLLRRTRNADSVVCDGCYEGHDGEVERVTYANGVTRLYMYCPDYGRIEVDPQRLHQWAPDYARVTGFLSEALACRGGPREPVPGRLWNLGRTAVAGQSRPVWLARRIFDDLRPHLPVDRLSVLFVMGIMPRTPLDIDPERVFDIRDLVSADGSELRLDVDAVRGQLGELVRSSPPKKEPRAKDSNRAEAIKAAKRELHAHIISMKVSVAYTPSGGGEGGRDMVGLDRAGGVVPPAGRDRRPGRCRMDRRGHSGASTGAVWWSSGGRAA